MNVEQARSSSNMGSTTPDTISMVGGGASVLVMVSVLDTDVTVKVVVGGGTSMSEVFSELDVSLSAKAGMILLLPPAVH